MTDRMIVPTVAERYKIPNASSKLNKDELLALYRTMFRIRTFELNVEQLFLNKKIPGFVHLYVGEEAVATGMMANLRKDDYITSTHRGHGHAVAKGAEMNRMMAELFGKKTGYCRGKGGSMHIADFSVGMLGANGIVGGGYNIAAGAGMSINVKGTDQVAVCFFGDGASSRGTFHEAMNWAAVYQLPVIFVNENNCYASTTPVEGCVSTDEIADRAEGYGIPGMAVDGNDVTEVYDAAKFMVERARNGEGPGLLECKTYRIKGHFVGDPERYRTKDEVQKWQSENDPIKRFHEYLAEQGKKWDKDIDKIEKETEEEVQAAVDFAEKSEWPDPEDALEDLFTFSPNEFPPEVN